MGLPDGLTSENQTLGALWEGWEVTEVRQNCTAVSHAVFNSATVRGMLEETQKRQYRPPVLLQKCIYRKLVRQRARDHDEDKPRRRGPAPLPIISFTHEPIMEVCSSPPNTQTHTNTHTTYTQTNKHEKRQPHTTDDASRATSYALRLAGTSLPMTRVDCITASILNANVLK